MAGYEADISAITTAAHGTSMCQTLLLSATLTDDVTRLVERVLNSPHTVHVEEHDQGADDATAAASGAYPCSSLPPHASLGLVFLSLIGVIRNGADRGSFSNMHLL